MATYTENISVNDIRLLGNLGSTDVSDNDVQSLLSFATVQFNHDILTKHSDWMVASLSNEKENKIDGSNTTFYVPDYPIGDYNDDGKIDENDVIAYTLDSSGTRTAYTVSSIADDEIGKIELASAPSASETLYLTWSSSPVELETPHSLAKLALVQLCNALMYTKVDAGKLQAYRVRHLAVMKPAMGFEKHYNDYRRTVTQILSKALKRKDAANTV